MLSHSGLRGPPRGSERGTPHAGRVLRRRPRMRISDADRRDIWEAVEAHLSAFRRHDAEGAFRLASPGIRAMFGTADVFVEMVRSSYPYLCEAQSVRPAELVALQGQLAQQVEVRGRRGEP